MQTVQTQIHSFKYLAKKKKKKKKAKINGIVFKILGYLPE